MLILWRTLLFAALWLAFESVISWAAFCQHQNEYSGAYQTTESYECVFRGPIASFLRWFGRWWVHTFDETDSYIALFTFVLAVGTLALWWSTRKLWEVATENERPWVGPITVGCQGLFVNRPIPAVIAIKNTGRSPALRMRVAHEGIILNQGQIPNPPTTWETPKALFPGAEDFYYPFLGRAPLSQADFVAINAGTRAAWVIARIEYFDGSGNPHHTNICTRWGGPNRPAFVPEGNNDAD
jgi:hypothetical protein